MMKRSHLIWLALTIVGTSALAAQSGDQAKRNLDLPQIVASLNADDLSANEIRAIGTYAQLKIVDLRGLDEGEYEAIEAALANTDDGWAMVQTAIVAHEVIEQELERMSIPIRLIVAATMDDTGTITIYIR